MAKPTLTLQEKTDAFNELAAAEANIAVAKATVQGLAPSPADPNLFTVSTADSKKLDNALDEGKGKALLAAFDLGGKPCGGGKPC
jgi:hypothetical protein